MGIDIKLKERIVEFKFWNGMHMFHDTENVYGCLKQQSAFNEEDAFSIQYDHVGNGGRFLQFIGIHDIRARAIFEGDIVRDKAGREFVVEYEDNFASFLFVYLKDRKQYKTMRDFIAKQMPFEIIGNIFEK
jgi:hypothetical protein